MQERKDGSEFDVGITRGPTIDNFFIGCKKKKKDYYFKFGYFIEMTSRLFCFDSRKSNKTLPLR